MRLAGPMDAPVEEGAGAVPGAVCGAARRPIRLQLQSVSAVAAGRPLLQDVDLDLASGEHVAIVGASGSGKSTLMAVLLGLQRPSSGVVLVDGEPLDRAVAERLWPGVAWVDPQVRVWNCSLADNVGQGRVSGAAVHDALASAELSVVAACVGDAALGDDGGLLSGGEAQRVRLARAQAQQDVRLVVLDEALRGLDRGQRTRLLERARQHWSGATLLCATHDLRDATTLDRVLVVAWGGIVEDGPPTELAANQGSRFRALLEVEQTARQEPPEGRPRPRMHGPAILASVPGHQRILVVSTTAGEAEILRIRDDLGRDPLFLTAPTAEARRVVSTLEVEPHVEVLLAPVSFPPADRGHRLDELVRRYALPDRFRDVVVVTDMATSTLLLRALAPDQLSTKGAVTVVGLPRGDRPVAVRRAVASGLVLGVASGLAEPLVPILVLPGAVALFGLALLLVPPWRYVGRELLLAAAIAATVVLAAVAGSSRFPGAW